jgi:hypothetical protein
VREVDPLCLVLIDFDVPASEFILITTLHGPRRKHSLPIVGNACLQRRGIALEVIQLLLAYSLPRESVYRVVA